MNNIIQMNIKSIAIFFLSLLKAIFMFCLRSAVFIIAMACRCAAFIMSHISESLESVSAGNSSVRRKYTSGGSKRNEK